VPVAPQIKMKDAVKAGEEKAKAWARDAVAARTAAL